MAPEGKGKQVAQLSQRDRAAGWGNNNETTYAVHLRLIGKPVVNFLLVIIKHFSVGVTAHIAASATENNLMLNTSKTKEVIFYDSRRRHSAQSPPLLPGVAREFTLKILGVTLSSHLSASDHIRRVISGGVAVCPAHITASRSERRRPADCLQSCSGVEADVRLARLERLHNGDQPQTSRRVPATLQTLWLLLFRSACLWGAAGQVRPSDDAVQQDFKQLNSHTPYTSPSTVRSIAVLPSETTHGRQTAANTNQWPVYKKLNNTSAV